MSISLFPSSISSCSVQLKYTAQKKIIYAVFGCNNRPHTVATPHARFPFRAVLTMLTVVLALFWNLLFVLTVFGKNLCFQQSENLYYLKM